MTAWRNWQGYPAAVAFAAALAFPVVVAAGAHTYLLGMGAGTILLVLVLGFALFAALQPTAEPVGDFFILAGSSIGSALVLHLLPEAVAAGDAAVRAAGAAPGSAVVATRIGAAPGLFALALAAWLLAWLAVARLSLVEPANRGQARFLRILVPFLFGAWLLFLWEVIVRGFGVPFVILPPPSAIGAKLAASVPLLLADFRQTFLKAVLAGYAIGCGAGFLVAIIADRFGFLRRGLVPVGNLVSALPIIGIAPIMVMWFGFDWPSKAAVVVVMTFFPMLVNTLAGLSAADSMQRDLMRTYAAGYWQSLFKLRLPAALPFIFNALKINSTLAMIGAIVAEFFGTPVVGMGFRISTEVGRMNIDMVWAEIAVAALAGSVFYGVVALIERGATFWHPSYRQQT